MAYWQTVMDLVFRIPLTLHPIERRMLPPRLRRPRPKIRAREKAARETRPKRVG